MTYKVSSIAGINALPLPEQRDIYQDLIPPGILNRFQLSPYLVDKNGNDLFIIQGPAGSSSVEIFLYHQHGFPDPILYGHLTDTLNGQIHVLLYIMNDPESERYDVDKLPDGTPTRFGTEHRNIEAELASMQAGLTPGQIRKGLSLLQEATVAFEVFVVNLGHNRYMVDPLYYHNAVIFERYGFKYQMGRKRMQQYHEGFQQGGELYSRLDGSSPFRQPEAAQSIRLRSWAIHDGILGEAFSNVTMYKVIGKPTEVNTTPGVNW
ncbi:MAG: hypothetical protein DWQ07_00285 [Chloroflexi bacterium]|nr:MAG: hypothetical protein DWQ07_00285 [Chloroflexota bacterium]MBL1195771.1 hypothetical protein [Chloroflexota bacterium]NOH13062.1 hypothetical protein [Chloroflexota bacterium]